MRIVNNNLTVRSVLFSRASGLAYFAVFAFFVYKSFLLLPIWLSVKGHAEQAETDFYKKEMLAQQTQEEAKNKDTDLGRERYQKDFFNKLDDGEHLIVLYSDNQYQSETEVREELRNMYWWEELQQNFLVWWKNLDI